MIPMPLAAAHATFLAWKANASGLGDFSPDELDDVELAQLRHALAQFHDDVRGGLALVDQVISRRVIKRSRFPSPAASTAPT